MKTGDKVWYFDLNTFEVKEGVIKSDNYPYGIGLEDGTKPDRQWVFDNPDDLQNALRNYRNNNQVITNKLQHAIDEISLKKYNCDDLVGKYFACRDDKLYIYVKSVERLYRGPRLSGPTIYIYEDNEGFQFILDGIRDLNWEDVDNLKEISATEFTKISNTIYHKCLADTGLIFLLLTNKKTLELC